MRSVFFARAVCAYLLNSVHEHFTHRVLSSALASPFRLAATLFTYFWEQISFVYLSVDRYVRRERLDYIYMCV